VQLGGSEGERVRKGARPATATEARQGLPVLLSPPSAGDRSDRAWLDTAAASVASGGLGTVVAEGALGKGKYVVVRRATTATGRYTHALSLASSPRLFLAQGELCSRLEPLLCSCASTLGSPHTALAPCGRARRQGDGDSFLFGESFVGFSVPSDSPSLHL